MEFYHTVLSKALATGRISTADSVLTVCAGTHDRNTYLRSGFTDVTVSNVNDYMGDDIAPYKWQYVDAEKMPFADDSFDIVSVHGGLHHCFSPHRGMLEMYRVARKAVIVVEARNSLLMRAAVKFGFTDDYEIESVTGSNHFGAPAGDPSPIISTDGPRRRFSKPSRHSSRATNRMSISSMACCFPYSAWKAPSDR